MLDELAIYNLSVKYPNTVDLVREVERITRKDTIEELKAKVNSAEFQRDVIQSRESLQVIICRVLDELKGEKQ